MKVASTASRHITVKNLPHGTVENIEYESFDIWQLQDFGIQVYNKLKYSQNKKTSLLS